MNYLRQILYEMKTQRLVTWLTIAGTAIAIFLVMSDLMLQNVHTVCLAPESRRDRIFYGQYIDVQSQNGSFSGGMSLAAVEELYKGLEGVEKVSFCSDWTSPSTLKGTGKLPVSSNVKGVDAAYWQIYDYTFEEGAPFDEARAEAASRVAVISRSMATQLFGNGPVAGRKMEINKEAYTVVGVITDPSPIFSKSGEKVYVPLRTLKLDRANPYYPMSGSLQAVLLAAPGVSHPQLQAEVKKRYEVLNRRLEKDKQKAVYHQQPYDASTIVRLRGSNNDPDESGRTSRLVIYALLLLIPAINLSSMTRSRLRKRVSEFGLRRALGCSRLRLVAELLTENLLLTFAGTAIGVALSFLFCTLFSGYFISFSDSYNFMAPHDYITPTFSMLFSWSSLAIACGLCFILNLMSAGMPAWKASGITPAEALAGLHGGKY